MHKPPVDCPKLTSLADGCVIGACNMYPLIVRLAEALKAELAPVEVREHPAVKVILGQLSYLCGESIGPTTEALQAYWIWRGDV